jgi:hypothetical protein
MWRRMISAHQIALCTMLVFLTSFVVLAWNISQAGIAAGYNDPIAHVSAQDEAPIVSATIGIAKDGDWMTPKLMGRPFILKPPMLNWLAALSIRFLGLSLFSVRLPGLLLGAAGVATVFAWAAHARSIAAGALAAGLLLLSPFWQMFSRLCLTDVPASTFAAVALAGVAFDPRLIHRRTRVAFGLMGAASVLTKSAAGLLPFATVLLFWAALSRQRRPRIANIAESVFFGAALVAPWYIYQGLVHPRWLWIDHVKTQLIGTGLHWDRNSIIGSDSHVLYYLRRFVEMDPIVLLLAVVSLAGVLGVARSREQPAALLAICWAAITVTALIAFQASNLPYVALALPALCTMGAVCAPAIVDRNPAAIACVLGILLLARLVGAGQPWSMRVEAPPLAGANAMRAYYELNRDTELISIDPDDQFYSLTIPLPRVRYAVLDPAGVLARYAPHYVQLGIILSSAEFVNLPMLVPEFETRLHAWGIDSQEPIGSTITMRSAAEISGIVHGKPESDFYLPVRFLDGIADPERTHQLIQYSSERVFLLSRAAKPRALPVRPLPVHW